MNRSEHNQTGGFNKLFSVIVFGLFLFSFGYLAGSGKINLAILDNNVQTQNQSLPDNLDYSSVDEVYKVLKANFDGELTAEQLITGLKDGLAGAANDPYTEYQDEEESAQFNDDLNGTFSGIGAELSKEDELIKIISPIDGYPAQEAGLLPQDTITEINGETTLGLTLTEAVNKIRGEAGSEVTLTIFREGQEEKDYKITRADITIPSVETEIKDDNIGYIKISRFSDDTVSLVASAAGEFKVQNVKAVVLDVRGNPGGLLDASVDISDLWLSDGVKILEEKRGEQVIETYIADDRDGNPFKDIPTVVLIDKGSASASEIVAGALKDNQAATLIGQESFGKGSVQSLQPISSGGVLKITIARWFTPNGRNIDKEGISPDKEVERTIKDIQNDRDPQLNSAIKFLEQ